MYNVPSCYGADDLMIEELHNQACRICGTPVPPSAFAETPNDSFTPSTKPAKAPNTHKDTIDKAIKIAAGSAVVIGLAVIGKKFCKLFHKP